MGKPDEHPGKGQGPNKQQASLTLRMVTDANGDGLPNHGDRITFDVVSEDEWHQVEVHCTQHGAIVLGAVQSPSNMNPVTLSSMTWPGGAAEGVAMLQQFAGDKTKELARLEFAVGA